jgi:peptidoglycan/LPS O-acetylase OafA/YrhL
METATVSGRRGLLLPVAGGGAPEPAPVLPRLGTHLPALDGLRGLAILLVMTFHFSRAVPLQSWVGDWLALVPRAGWCGVDLFFVLSGFLITGILFDARGSRGYFRNFYMRRLLRIFPLYYGVLLFLFVILPLATSFRVLAPESIRENQGWLWCYCSNVRMVLTGEWLFNSDWCQLNHFWSLAVEEHFYLLWPLAVFRLDRRTMMALCGVCVLTAPAIRVGLVLADGPTFAPYILTPCRMDALALGGWVALAVRGPRGLAGLVGGARWLALASGTLLVGLFVWRHGFSSQDPVMQTAGYSLLALFFAAALVPILATPRHGLPGRFVHSSALGFFGKYSYSLYVFHVLLYPVARAVLPTAALADFFQSQLLAVAVQGAAMIAMTLLAAVLSWHLYEKQFLKLKRFFEYRKDKP